MKNGDNQEIRSKDQLNKRGWTITDAAKRLNRSVNHVSMVLSGKRTSKKLTRELSALPQIVKVEREVSHV